MKKTIMHLNAKLHSLWNKRVMGEEDEKEGTMS